MRSEPREACDSSVLVPALLTWHEHHEVARTAVDAPFLAVPAHVLAETYSAVTRMPRHLRLSPSSAIGLLRGLPNRLLTLDAAAVLRVLADLASAGISGGATYDGLVGATAAQHGLVLVSVDRRARPTYDAVGVEVRLLA